MLLDRNKIRDLYDIVYMLRHCKFSGDDIIETIMHYRITYRPEHIIDLIKAKKEDPFDYEGIESATMLPADYQTLKNDLLMFLADRDFI